MAVSSASPEDPASHKSNDLGKLLERSPAIFVFDTHLPLLELHSKEDLVHQLGGQLTYDPHESRIFIGMIGQKKRAAFDLRAKGVWTEEVVLPSPPAPPTESQSGGNVDNDGPVRKKRKVDPESQSTNTTSKASSFSSTDTEQPSQNKSPPSRPEVALFWPDLGNNIIVLKLAWLEACLKQEKLVPYKPYLVYFAKVIPEPTGETAPTPLKSSGVTYIKASQDSSQTSTTKTVTSTILERAKADAPATSSSQLVRRRFGDHGSRTTVTSPKAHPPKLHRTTTSEFEELAKHPLPPLPDWATKPNHQYASLRSTPLHTANAAFIAQLTKIKDARLLRLDEIGVRAYATSIASLSAYPHRIGHPEEITRLPGCEEKIAMLWSEWHYSADSDAERSIEAVRELEADTDLKHLDLFWNIWGVGAETARKFYYEHGWRDLDDIVEFGWNTLTRVQQIGVKFYDDFLVKIPRREVEEIRDVILRHARFVLGIAEEDFDTPGDVECVIVGGYRRGKDLCGDVDVILSHRDESKTKDLVVDVVRSLESEGWITHTLALHTTNSDRGQATLPFHGEQRGHGFDSLDKALCVWQDPIFEGKDDDPPKKNPNIHRRVDIIISSWRTVGCAVLGWSGGTTFQRDIRRFVAKIHGWKFDSSGVRDRGSGEVLDFERPREMVRSGGGGGGGGGGGADGKEEETYFDDGDTWEDRERRLMEGLGIGYRPATERCTG